MPNKTKAKLLKKNTRKDVQKMRKGGYHKDKRGDVKTMRQNKKKDIGKELDESSTTTGIRGFLSNVKLRHGKHGEKTSKKQPWYLSKESLKSSLEEALTEWGLENLLNEISGVDILKRKEDREKQKEKEERKEKNKESEKKDRPSLGKKAAPHSKKFFKDLLQQAQDIEKQGGPRNEKEAKILNFVKERGHELVKRSGATGQELKDKLSFSKSGRLGGEAQKSKEKFLNILNRRAEVIRMKGGPTNPEQQELLKLDEKLQADPNKMQNIFLRSFFSSFPEQLLTQAEQEFSKSGKPLNKPQRVQIWRLLELPQVPIELVLKYLSYFENREQEVIKANKEAMKTMAVAGQRGVKGATVGAPEKASSKSGAVDPEEQLGTMQLQDFDEEPEEVGGKGSYLGGEEGGYNAMTDIMKTLKQTGEPSNPSLEDDLSDQGEVSEKEIEPFTGEGHKEIEHMPSEDAIKKIGPEEFMKIGSRVLLDKSGVYRNKALKIISNWIAQDMGKKIAPEQLNHLLDVSTYSKTGKDGSKYLSLIKPEDADPEYRDIYHFLYRAFNPETVLKSKTSMLGKNLEGENPLVNFVKDKIVQIWNRKMSKGQTSFEREEMKKEREAREKKEKESRRSPEEMKNLLKKHEEEKGKKAAFSHLKNLEKDDPRLARRMHAHQMKTKSLSPKDVQVVKLQQKLDDLASGRFGGDFSPERKQKLMQLLQSRIQQLQMPMTTESLKKVFQRMIEGKEEQLMEMLLSPESANKEEEVDVKEKSWDKARAERTKEFYPSSIQDWIRK